MGRDGKEPIFEHQEIGALATVVWCSLEVVDPDLRAVMAAYVAAMIYLDHPTWGSNPSFELLKPT